MLLLCHLRFTSNANHLWIRLYGDASSFVRLVFFFFFSSLIALLQFSNELIIIGTRHGAHMNSRQSHLPFINVEKKKHCGTNHRRNHSVHESYFWVTDKYSTRLNYEKSFKMPQTRPVITVTFTSIWIWFALNGSFMLAHRCIVSSQIENIIHSKQMIWINRFEAIHFYWIATHVY